MVIVNTVNPRARPRAEKRDPIDIGSLAMIGILMGVVFVLAGLMGEHPVFGAMTKVYAEKPSLTAGETFWLGTGVTAACAALYAWRITITKRR